MFINTLFVLFIVDVPRAVGTSVETLEGGDPVYRYVSSTPVRIN